ncbi:MAG: DUF354 domain-containing protein [Bacteroidales bacterium]|nr:DUF354 domain-containing protein [Bacteroidales bacterium]
MRVLVYLGHPAHFHNYKNTIAQLKADGHEVAVLIKKKDILEELLKNAGIPYHNILEEGRKDSQLGIAIGLLKRTWRLDRFCREFKPDILTGSSVENSLIGPLRHIPVINIGEDDADVVPKYARTAYPGASVILCPDTCDCGKWNAKAVKYPGYQELGYLHPENFTPRKEVVQRYFGPEKPYFLMRFSGLNAHHDAGIRGINNEIARRLIEILQPHGRVLITSERLLDASLEPYRIAINPLDIHHVMAYADLYLGDSQTMAAEAGVLGVPYVRFNDFVGKIGYLKELEEKYQLGFGITPDREADLYATVQSLLDMPDRKAVFESRRQRMLGEKINFATFLTDFIEHYKA